LLEAAVAVAANQVVAVLEVIVLIHHTLSLEEQVTKLQLEVVETHVEFHLSTTL
jgi:hypothetical protein